MQENLKRVPGPSFPQTLSGYLMIITHHFTCSSPCLIFNSKYTFKFCRAILHIIFELQYFLSGYCQAAKIHFHTFTSILLTAISFILALKNKVCTCSLFITIPNTAEGTTFLADLFNYTSFYTLYASMDSFLYHKVIS